MMLLALIVTTIALIALIITFVIVFRMLDIKEF